MVCETYCQYQDYNAFLRLSTTGQTQVVPDGFCTKRPSLNSVVPKYAEKGVTWISRDLFTTAFREALFVQTLLVQSDFDPTLTILVQIVVVQSDV